MTVSEPKIIVALDFDDANKAKQLIDQLHPQFCRLKVGKELFTHCGPAIVEYAHNKDFSVFLDLKFHDIPHTTAKACAQAARLGVWMVNVHVSGGQKMLAAAYDAIHSAQGHQPLLIGVTVLTSLNHEDLLALGLTLSPEEQVLHFAKMAKSEGLDGIVCSPNEIAIVREHVSSPFVLVTPGVRPSGSEQQDQVRIMTPEKALLLGADYLVIGRPITQATDPAKALKAIFNSIS